LSLRRLLINLGGALDEVMVRLGKFEIDLQPWDLYLDINLDFDIHPEHE